MPAPPALRLLTDGTALDDVAALRTALAERLALYDLLPTRDELPASAAEDGGNRAVSSLPLLVPIIPGENEGQVRSDPARRITRVPTRTDLILRTSGSTTGTGRLVAMSAAILMASTRATHIRLGGPGTWLLPLPARRVAGLQILIRSLEAGTEPVMVGASTRFSPAALTEALRSACRSTGVAVSRLYVSLIPTQLIRVLQDPQARRALAGADVVLLGGAAADPVLLARACGAGVVVATTYGMDETGGGCIYGGRSLEGAEITIQAPDTEGAGRILISDPILAKDYLDAPSHNPVSRPNAGEDFHRSGTRHVLTISSRGRPHPDGHLGILGRLDDVIITEGIKIGPRCMEEALTDIDSMAETCAVGPPDAQWRGAVVVAVMLEAERGPDSPKRLDDTALREAVHARLDGVHAPKWVLILEALLLRSSGRVDRHKVARLLAATTTDVTSESSTPGS